MQRSGWITSVRFESDCDGRLTGDMRPGADVGGSRNAGKEMGLGFLTLRLINVYPEIYFINLRVYIVEEIIDRRSGYDYSRAYDPT